MFTFQKRYFLLSILLFIVEVLIALYVHDDIIRPYVGDLLVVILLYCMVKSCLNSPVQQTAVSVLLFSYLVETLQYFDLVHHLGLGHSKLANVIIGNYFTWIDILAYSLGFIIIIMLERRYRVQGLSCLIKKPNHESQTKIQSANSSSQIHPPERL